MPKIIRPTHPPSEPSQPRQPPSYIPERRERKDNEVPQPPAVAPRVPITQPSPRPPDKSNE